MLPHFQLIICWPSQWLSSKESACNTGDLGLFPVSGRSPKGGNGNPLQYTCLENPQNRGVYWLHGVAKSQTRLSTHAQTSAIQILLLAVIPQNHEILSSLSCCKVKRCSMNWLRGHPNKCTKQEDSFTSQSGRVTPWKMKSHSKAT